MFIVTESRCGSSTKSMISHLQSKHKITVKRSYEVSEDHSSNQPKLKVGHMDNYLVKRESAGEIIARLVAVDGLTFNQIATKSLIRRAFKSDGYSLSKSPQIIRDYFIKELEKTVTIVTEKINNIKKNSGRFSISFDESTSVRNRRYMNLNLHDVKKRIEKAPPHLRFRFGLNVSSADERWYYAKLESRLVRGKNIEVSLFSSRSYEMKTIAYTDSLVIQIYQLS